MAQIAMKDPTKVDRAYKYNHYRATPVNLPKGYDAILSSFDGAKGAMADQALIEKTVKQELTNLENNGTDTVKDKNQADNSVRWNF